MPEIESDIPWWALKRKDLNESRLKMAVTRGAFVIDKDEVKTLGNKNDSKSTADGRKN